MKVGQLDFLNRGDAFPVFWCLSTGAFRHVSDYTSMINMMGTFCSFILWKCFSIDHICEIIKMLKYQNMPNNEELKAKSTKLNGFNLTVSNVDMLIFLKKTNKHDHI